MTENGTDIVFKANGELYAGQTSADLSIERDMIETTNKTTGKYKKFIPGKINTTIDVEGIVKLGETSGAEDLLSDLKADTAVTVYWGGNESGETYYECSGYISSVSISAPDNDAATGSVSIQVIDEPEKKTVT
jgi:predicted secreted protein